MPHDVIPFNKPVCLESSVRYIDEAARRGELRGDFRFCQKCSEWMEKHFGTPKALLTTSGSDALEMAAILCDIHHTAYACYRTCTLRGRGLRDGYHYGYCPPAPSSGGRGCSAGSHVNLQRPSIGDYR